jgi:hypothetical protein
MAGTASDFVEYEADLTNNLKGLLKRLSTGGLEEVVNSNLGQPRLVSKKLTSIPKKSSQVQTRAQHAYFSDPTRAFEHLLETHKLEPEFRLIGDFGVELHVVSALWINTVGHKYDAALGDHAYGSRLRRLKPSAGDTGDFHLEAIGSFERYIGPYRRWRENGMRSIRSELTEGRPVIALSMDLTSYYHQIDVKFAVDPRFLAVAGILLTDWELEFTKGVVAGLTRWSERAAEMMAQMGAKPQPTLGGLPIGISMVPIFANVLLLELDDDLVRGLSPVYYGRYVDDLFLVLRDPGDITSGQQLLEFVSARTKSFPRKVNGEKVTLKLGGAYQGKTNLVLQQSKQKVFFLSGQGGLDLLANIESQIRNVSSERRLMASPGHLETMASAKVLTAAGPASEEADTLRRADGLAVRRLSWSILLRAVEMLARDLRQDDWKEERAKFYAFAHSHILRPDKILEHLDYLSRLLSIAVALLDWEEAEQLVESATESIQSLARATEYNALRINGHLIPQGKPSLWLSLVDTGYGVIRETILRSLRWSSRQGVPRPLSRTALRLCDRVGLGSSASEIYDAALRMRESDWAKSPYKDHLRRDAVRERPRVAGEEELYDLYAHAADLRRFLTYSHKPFEEYGASRVHPRCNTGEDTSLLPYLVPTRPYTTQEISLFLPELCVFGSGPEPSSEWARFTRAVRGVWVWSSGSGSPLRKGADSSTADNPLIAVIGSGGPGEDAILLGISNLLTTDKSWVATAGGRSDLSPERYERLKRVVDQAVTAVPRPKYLLLPELSVPERWLESVGSLLRDANISLIAGLDYHHPSIDRIHSSAVLLLSDKRLGFPAWTQVRQLKSLPAPGEEEKLLHHFGKEWSILPLDKRVYIHDGFCFGVLVCSELQNLRHRARFQGEVDAILVLSWNQDLETFSALVEAASLDVHAYVALVNNRKYGDSRVRAPGKPHHERDLCRLRGGENEHLVVVKLNVQGLRAFQSRAKRWPSETDPFKPVPEAFKLEKRRATLPR